MFLIIVNMAVLRPITDSINVKKEKKTCLKKNHRTNLSKKQKVATKVCNQEKSIEMLEAWLK